MGQEADGLDGLSESHLICEYDRVVLAPGVGDPVYSTKLIVSQLKIVISAKVAGLFLDLYKSMEKTNSLNRNGIQIEFNL